MTPGRLEVLGLADLPELSATSAALATAHARWLARQVFVLGGEEISFELLHSGTSPSPSDLAPPWAEGGGLWLQVEHQGRPLLLQVSPTWVASALGTEGWSPESMKGPVLASWCALRWLERLPASLILVGVAERVDTLSPAWRDLPHWGRWQGRHVATAEPSGHVLTVCAKEPVAAAALLQAAAGLSARSMPSPLCGLPLDLPLVGARWTVDAAELADLSVGDVLLVG